MKKLFAITAAAMFLQGCVGAGGYGVARVNDNFGGPNFQSDIVYAELSGEVETPISICPRAQVGAIVEKSINGQPRNQWEVSAGCSFGLFGK